MLHKLPCCVVLNSCVSLGALLLLLRLQPAILFVGDRFESDADFKLAKSMLLDMFRGKQVGGRSHQTPVERSILY